MHNSKVIFNNLTCCKPTNNVQYFLSVLDIPKATWDALDCQKNLYLQKDYLECLEKNNKNLLFSYIIVSDNQKNPIAFACLQIISFYIDDIHKDTTSMLNRIKDIGRKIHLIPKEKSLKILICGNTFVSGEHGIFIKKNQDKKQVLKEISKAIIHFSNYNSILKEEIKFFLIKDFVNKSLPITNTLKHNNYNPFLVEPNMVLKLDSSWQNFDDYLAALKTKFRVKAKKALQLSAPLQVKEVTLENIEELLPAMTQLYKKVATKAAFNLGDFNLNTYQCLKKKMGDNYLLKTYFLDGNVVGFMSGIINYDSLDAHFVGIDYTLNKQYAIYQKMLYDYISLAISKKVRVLNFGRTASEIKSSIGAVPEDLTIYIRHKKSIKNKILKLFLKRIAPTPFHQKFPFKQIVSNEKR